MTGFKGTRSAFSLFFLVAFYLPSDIRTIPKAVQGLAEIKQEKRAAGQSLNRNKPRSVSMPDINNPPNVKLGQVVVEMLVSEGVSCHGKKLDYSTKNAALI